MADCAHSSVQPVSAGWPLAPPPRPPPASHLPLFCILWLTLSFAATPPEMLHSPQRAPLRPVAPTCRDSARPLHVALRQQAHGTLCRPPATTGSASCCTFTSIDAHEHSKGVRKARLKLELWRKPWRSACCGHRPQPPSARCYPACGPHKALKSLAGSPERDRASTRPRRLQRRSLPPSLKLKHPLFLLSSHGVPSGCHPCVCSSLPHPLLSPTLPRPYRSWPRARTPFRPRPPCTGTNPASRSKTPL